MNKAVWATIDLAAIRHNLREIKKKIGPLVKIMVVVKADGYGHGMVEVSKAALKEGVDALVVDNLEEGVEIREAGINVPILILGPLAQEEIGPLIYYHLCPTILDKGVAEEISRASRKAKKKVKVHVNVDTGMGRLGVYWEKALSFIEGVGKMDGIKIEGVYTHFPSADGKNKAFSHLQIQRFQSILKGLRGKGICPSLVHASNSAGVLNLPESYFNMVRPGLIVYGCYPSSEVSHSIMLGESMSLKCKIAFIKKVPAGASISYSRTYTIPKATSIAILPIGYADGYPYSLSNKAEVLIGGRRAPILGRVCMGQTIVDVGHIRGVKVGDEVVLWGNQGKERISVEEVSFRANTIPYELLTRIGRNVRRVYRNSN
ncbi:MAG: alanine racemase [Candidatus Aerophobetes bacterium]|nr:alanine racemase [Candidatus Aerophobetes bacterium]